MFGFNKAFACFCGFLLFAFCVSHALVAQTNQLANIQRTISSVQKLVDSTQQFITKINSVVDKVINDDLYNTLINGKEFDFPRGVKPPFGTENYVLVINRVFLTPDGLFAEVFLRINLSAPDKIGNPAHALYFMADRVPFSRSGGFSGDLRLYLLRSDSIQVGDGYAIQMNGVEQGGLEKSCFVTFNCKGFKDATLTGAVNFNPNAIVKNGKTKERVSVAYQVQADKLSNFIIDLKDIPVFEFRSLPGFTCKVDRFILDKSELRNTTDFELPAAYIDVLAKKKVEVKIGSDWEGVFIPNISINLPPSFEKDTNSLPAYITSKGLIIDQYGVTGLNKAVNLLSGNIKGWKYSIDTVEVGLTMNAIARARLAGKVTLPVCKEDSQVSFQLMVDNKNDALQYSGSVATSAHLNASAFGLARMKLTHMAFDFNYQQEQFFPSATLTGNLTIAPLNSAKSEKAFGSISADFAGLKISSKSPYINKETGGFINMSTSGSMVSNFPVTFTKLDLINNKGNDQQLGLSTELLVKLFGENKEENKGNAFEGKAGFVVWTERNASTKRWQYKDVQLNSIDIALQNGSFDLRGQVARFTDDANYGSGFCGSLKLSLIKKIEVDASVIFGRNREVPVNLDQKLTDVALRDNENDYRFWFADAAATFPAFPVVGIVAINGFTGGLYHKMKLEPNAKLKEGGVTCRSASGMVFLPNSSMHLGLIAGVGVQSHPTKAVFNGDLTFGLEFNKNGGLRRVAFYGEAQLLTGYVAPPTADELKKKTNATDSIAAAKSKAPIPKMEGSFAAAWFTEYDVSTSTFTGDFDVYVNVANVVRGIQGGDKAGHIAIMFSPNKNYVWIGTPVDYIGLNVAKLFDAQAYVCAGNTLPVPAIRELPEQIRGKPLNYGSLETGAGLAFGARGGLNGSCGANIKGFGCDRLWIGADLYLIAGIDVLLSKSRLPVYCGNTTGPRGINNWYATGQLFIVGGLKLGVKYDCPLGNGEKNILEATLAAYIFAQLPRPTFVKGELQYKFSILAFNVEGQIDATFGEQCELQDADKDIVFISHILPDSGTTEVSVTEPISVHFTRPIERFEFKLPDESNKEGGTLPYRGMVPNENIVVRSNNVIIPCTYTWNPSKTVLRLSPLKAFPENALVEVIAKVNLQYHKNGSWQTSAQSETRTVVFKTAKEPARIELANVAYAYPLPDMKNFYINESATGYVKLFSLTNRPMQLASDYSYEVRFTSGSGESIRVGNVTTNNTVNGDQFTFPLPNDKLMNGQNYTLQIVKTPKPIQLASAQVNGMTVGTVDRGAGDTIVLEYKFRVSHYNTLAQKLNAYNDRSVQVLNRTVVQTLKMSGAVVNETFGNEEKSGYRFGDITSSKPLVRSMGADFTQGFKVTSSVPDSVIYSSYSDQLTVAYNVFEELHLKNQKDEKGGIRCAIQDNIFADCNTATGSGSTTFPKAKYFYKLGYFLPGREVKNSETSISFDLPTEIKVEL